MLPMAVARSFSGGVAIGATLCTSGFMDDVTFAHNGQEQAPGDAKRRILRVIQQGAAVFDEY